MQDQNGGDIASLQNMAVMDLDDGSSDRNRNPRSMSKSEEAVVKSSSKSEEEESSMVIGGFSIDSDDEEQGDKVDQGKASDVHDVRVDHPLSDDRLVSAPQVKVQVGLNPAVGSPAGTQSQTTGTSTTSNINHSNTATMTPAVPMTLNQNNSLSSGGSMSKFASNFVNMAQRAANSVAAATAPPPAMTIHGAPPNAGALGIPAGTTPVPLSPSLASAPQGSQGAFSGSSNMNAGAASDMGNDQKMSLIQENVGELLPGERIIMFLSNLLHVGDTNGFSYTANTNTSSSNVDNQMWCCAMTYYRLILFSTGSAGQEDSSDYPDPPADWNPLCWPHSSPATKTIEIPLAAMDRVEKGVYQANGSSYMGLVVSSKDCGRVVRFTTTNYADTGRAYDSLTTYSFPGRRNLGYLFAFESKRPLVMASVTTDSNGQQSISLPPTKKRFDHIAEYSRLLSQTNTTQSPWTIWKGINSAYQLSPTYPSILVGPATMDEDQPDVQRVLQQSAAFRSEQRLPALTWCGSGGGSIWRSSQPKIGLQGNRSSADELILRHIVESARGANALCEPIPRLSKQTLQKLTGDFSRDWIPEPTCGLKILDLRPRSSAMANRTGGYGYENTSNYVNTTIQFCNIGNIHAVRDSYQKLCSICSSTATADVQWNGLVEDTKWLSHLRLILAASWEAAYWVHCWRLPVLAHCSHGWDRTSQVAALAELLLDPYYRTMSGFACLVEKDFMSFGHPFHTRCAHGEGGGASSTDEGQVSPIFLQFIDAVYQVVKILPNCFEFTPKYLLELSFQIYSCRFGTMLCDTERERELLAGIRQRTYSVWDHLEGIPENRNPDYDSSKSQGVLLMPLPVLMRNVSLWSERHCFFTPKPTEPPETD